MNRRSVMARSDCDTRAERAHGARAGARQDAGDETREPRGQRAPGKLSRPDSLPTRRNVAPSRSPRKYLASSRSNTEPAGETQAKRVADDRSFTSSGEPKISEAERPSTARTASAHSERRGPSTGWRRYAAASSRLLIAYRCDVGLNPSPSNWGKTYHIQCDRFRPLRISASACA